jgi:SprT protein
MGDASASMMRIRLSIPLWPRATEAEQRKTVIHEVCHLLNPIINGKGLPSHGKAWGRLMRRCGLSPTRCHKVDRTGLARKMPRVAVAKCRCMNHELTRRVYHKILRGVKYKCRKCRAVLALDIVTTAQTCSN